MAQDLLKDLQSLHKEIAAIEGLEGKKQQIFNQYTGCPRINSGMEFYCGMAIRCGLTALGVMILCLVINIVPIIGWFADRFALPLIIVATGAIVTQRNNLDLEKCRARKRTDLSCTLAFETVYGTVGPLVFAVFIFMPFFLVTLPFLKFIKTALDKKIAAINEEADEEFQEEYGETLLALQQQIKEHWQKALNITKGDWYPQDAMYYSSQVLTFFIKAMQNRKANNITDLVNLLDSHQHRAQMLSKQNQLLQNQAQMNRQLSEMSVQIRNEIRNVQQTVVFIDSYRW